MSQTPEQQEMAKLIIEILNIDDVEPSEIEPDAIMFDDTGLGLDSIDALEIAVAIAEQYARNQRRVDAVVARPSLCVVLEYRPADFADRHIPG